MSDPAQFGGQAVVEGVMMRSPRYFAVACRRPDEQIVVHVEPVTQSVLGRLQWLNQIFLRGSLALIDAMVLGGRALSFSASQQLETESPSEAVGSSSRSINDIAIGSTLAIGFLIGVALFLVLPSAITDVVGILIKAIEGHPIELGSLPLNLIDGLVRILIFLGYILAISAVKNVRRVFMYHGAEHKAINTFEAGRALVVEQAMQSSRIHPRCGTSFIVVVLILSILVFSLFGRPVWYLRLPLHLLLIPVVAGIAYEAIKLAGRFRSATPTRILLAPGLWSQYLTTREPTADQVEVALAALKAVIDRENEMILPQPTVAAS
ncbi:MAG: DUF1385 domain-containing protein [Armatimonadetes bacterium]|nr:DUF1385 domain-containing protein [Armatimonadota bacterium]